MPALTKLRDHKVPAEIPARPLLSVKDVSRLVGVHEETIYRAIRSGTFPGARRLGGRVFVSRLAFCSGSAGKRMTSNPEEPTAMVLGRCIVCGGPVLGTEPGAFVGSSEVVPDAPIGPLTSDFR